MKRPWMPLYVGDYLADTRNLNNCEHGSYLLLLMHLWNCGKLPPDDRSLARIACCHPPHWPRLKEVLIQYFTIQEDGSWIQKRLSLELTKSEEISNKRKAAAEQMLSKRRANAQQMLTQSQSHTQSYKKDSAGARETSLNGSHAPALADFTDKAWEQIIDSYKRFGKWHHLAGPEPPSPSCRCPKHLLAKHGLTLAVPS